MEVNLPDVFKGQDRYYLFPKKRRKVYTDSINVGKEKVSKKLNARLSGSSVLTLGETKACCKNICLVRYSEQIQKNRGFLVDKEMTLR